MTEYLAKRDRNRCPTHPGELLREDVIPATGKTRSEIAALLGISRQHLYDILNERKPVSPTVAVRLGKLFGDGAGVWARMQSAYDTWNAECELSDEIRRDTHNQNKGGVKRCLARLNCTCKEALTISLHQCPTSFAKRNQFRS